MKALATLEKNIERRNGERRAGDAAWIAETLHSRGRISLRVHGTSMLPWMRPGDIALVRRISAEHARCGDIVMFRRENQLFVHRVVEKRNSLNAAKLFSKGDAHPSADGAVEEQELLGRVVRIYRNCRRIDLDAPEQLALGLVLSQLSLHSRFWYPVAKLVAKVTRPARRMINSLGVLNATFR